MGDGSFKHIGVAMGTLAVAAKNESHKHGQGVGVFKHPHTFHSQQLSEALTQALLVLIAGIHKLAVEHIQAFTQQVVQALIGFFEVCDFPCLALGAQSVQLLDD